MAILPSGSILPAGLFSEGTDSFSGHDHNYKNFGIKAGIIINCYEADDKKNLSQSVPEYDVAVIEQNENASQNVITYQNCPAAEMFGGISDFFEFKYRKQTKTDKKGNEKTFNLQNGSQVLIACLNGSAEKAVIIGALKHPKRKSKLTKDAEHSMAGEFNGISVNIDKEGALSISFKGATDTDGKPLKEKIGGSYLKIEKDGSLSFGDGNKETIRLDKDKKTISIQSEKSMSLTTDDVINISSKKDTNQTMEKWSVKATGSVSMSGEKFDINSKGNFDLKASAFSIDSEGSVKIKGQQIDIKGSTVMIGEKVMLGGASAQPAVNSTTNFVGVGNLGAPVITQAMGPFSATVFIA